MLNNKATSQSFFLYIFHLIQATQQRNKSSVILAPQVNLFAKQNMPAQLWIQSWKPMTSHEMRLFFGFMFAIGMTAKLDIQLYWSSDEVLNKPFFGRTMSRNRFLLILKFLHFTDLHNVIKFLCTRGTLPWETQLKSSVPRGQDGYNPLFKIRPVYDNLRKRFGDIYQLEQQLSLDKSTTGWRGNLHFQCYNPSSPTNFTSRHSLCRRVLPIMCHSGNFMLEEMHILVKRELHTMRLMEEYKDQGYVVYLDNYYSSPVLFNDLFQNGISACGTVCVNWKGLPKWELQETKLSRERM